MKAPPPTDRTAQTLSSPGREFQQGDYASNHSPPGYHPITMLPHCKRSTNARFEGTVFSDSLIGALSKGAFSSPLALSPGSHPNAAIKILARCGSGQHGGPSIQPRAKLLPVSYDMIRFTWSLWSQCPDWRTSRKPIVPR